VSLFDKLHFAIDAQNLRHLRLEASQVVADLVRLHLLLIEDLAHRALSQLAKAGVLFRRAVLARVASQEPRRPQLVRIAEVLRLAAGEVDNPRLGLRGDRRLLAGPRPIIERRQRTQDQRPLDTALNGLMVRAYGPVPPEKRMARPGRPATSAPVRPGPPVPFASGQSRATPPNLPRSSPIRSPSAVPPRLQTSLPNQSRMATGHVGKNESRVRDWFQGIDELESRSVTQDPPRSRANEFFFQDWLRPT